jgi:O-antigen/teichoic acid export membrane protein
MTDQSGEPERPADGDRAGLAGVASAGALNLGGAVVSAVCGVGLTVIVTHNFPRSVAGAFFVAMSLFLIVETIANLSAYNGAIYFIARLRALRDEHHIPAMLRAAVIPVALSSAAGTAALAFFAGPLARFLLDGHAAAGVSPAAVAGALRALAVALPCAALSDTWLGAARGYRAMRPTVLVDRVGRSVLQFLGVLAVALAGSPALLAPVWALPYIPASVVAFFWLRRVMRRYRGSQTASPAASGHGFSQAADHGADGDSHGKPSARGFWRFTGPRSLASLAQIVIQRLDIVLVGIMKGPVDAAVYTAATRFLVVGQLANAAISMAAQPQFTHLFAVRDRAGAKAVYQATTTWLILLTWPLYLLAVIFGPGVLTIFGRAYHAGSTVMVILGLAMLVATASGQVDTVLITAGRSSWSLLNGLLAMSVNIGVDVALIPRLGIVGAAIGWAAAICLSNLVPLAQVARTVRVHPFGQGPTAACVLTTLSFAVIPLALRGLAGHAAVVSVAAIALGCVVMTAGLWQLRRPLRLAALPSAQRDIVPASRKGTRWPDTWWP